MAHTLFVSNLPPDADEQWLKSHAAHPERILSVKILNPGGTGSTGVTAAVEIDGDRVLANQIAEKLHGRIVGGCKLRVYAPLHS
jgi:hypothetical protein